MAIHHVEGAGGGADHGKGGDGFHALGFFLDLFVDEPLEHALGGVVLFGDGEGVQVVDPGGDLLFVREGVFEHLEDALPEFLGRFHGVELDLDALVLEVLRELEGVFLLFLELDAHPLVGALEALVEGVVGHRQVEEGGEELAVDLGVDFLRHFLADHGLVLSVFSVVFRGEAKRGCRGFDAGSLPRGRANVTQVARFSGE